MDSSQLFLEPMGQAFFMLCQWRERVFSVNFSNAVIASCFATFFTEETCLSRLVMDTCVPIGAVNVSCSCNFDKATKGT